MQNRLKIWDESVRAKRGKFLGPRGGGGQGINYGR